MTVALLVAEMEFMVMELLILATVEKKKQTIIKNHSFKFRFGNSGDASKMTELLKLSSNFCEDTIDLDFSILTTEKRKRRIIA
jgi:hypothetical protein